MKFSFDECEIINFLFNEENKVLETSSFISKVEVMKNNTENQDLLDLCESIILKFNEMNTEKYNGIISNLPVDTISVY